jgi:zinc/manganese transport system permease protein
VTADPIAGLGHMLAQPFEVRALVAGGLVAAACGLVGWFLVLRVQVFTGDALSHVAFTGALGALAAGVDLRIGLFVGCAGFGAVMGLLGDRGRADDVVIGNTFAWILGVGVLCLTLYTSSGGGNGTAGVSVLFGSIYGLTATQATVAATVGALILLAMLAMGRPLLFASVDEAVAAAAGVPVRPLGIAFLALVGVTAGEATQAVGALLLLGLLAAPAATAQRVTQRPWRSMALSVALAVGAVWGGLGLAYGVASLPPSFAILAVATGCYAASLTIPTRRRIAARRSVDGSPGDLGATG